MGVRGATIAVVLVAVALAGCAQEAPRPASSATPPPTLVVTDVQDVAALQDQTFSNESHLHDYWGGRTELSIISVEEPRSILQVGGPWSWGFWPEDGVVVPQGTSKLVVTTSWTSAVGDLYSNPELWVRTPSSHESIKVADLTPDTPVAIPVPLADADIPHRSLSAWRFEFRVHPDASSSLLRFNGVIKLDGVAHRGSEIPIYPAHPDLWQGRERIELFRDESSVFSFTGNATSDRYTCSTACPRIHRPANGSIVPHDAAWVEVTMVVESAPEMRLALKFHGGDARTWQEPPEAQEDATGLHYVIPVTPLMGDSPYSSQSVWEFVPVIASPVQDGVFAGAYRIEAHAVKGP